MNNILNLVIRLSNDFTKIIPRNELKKYKSLDWGNNGIGNRWANKLFNYSVIYSNNIKKYKTYSENINDKIPEEILNDYRNKNKNNNKKGIIGIFVHSKRNNVQNRPIHKNIRKEIIEQPCVVCGSTSDIICDHKNDLYNDKRVLDIKTQIIDDFQPLCNHCNLQKRMICQKEKENQKLYSAKEIPLLNGFEIEFPWEKKIYDGMDINCKKDTFWYDPIEFSKKIKHYIFRIIPLMIELKQYFINKK
jgi:hypothetical protein